MKRVIGALAVLAVGTMIASPAQAQDTSTTAAVALFDEGLRLLNEGKYSDACPKLAQSQKLVPNGGTLFALADCYERNGQYASAWITYKDALVRARAAGKADAEKRANDAATALEPKLSYVSVFVIDAVTIVSRDGYDLPRAAWNVATPLDPGTYRFTARAPGKKTWSSEVTLHPGEKRAVEVPSLEPDATASGAQTKPPADSTPQDSYWGTQRIVGVALAGVGVGGVIVGSVFGLSAASKNDDAKTHCTREIYCDAEGLRLDDEGRSAGTISTIAFAVGVAALAGGAVLFFTAPSGTPSSGSTGTKSARVTMTPFGVRGAF